MGGILEFGNEKGLVEVSFGVPGCLEFHLSVLTVELYCQATSAVCRTLLSGKLGHGEF